MGKNNNSVSYLEWESFNWNLEISNIESHNGCYIIPTNSKIIVSRNNEYKLNGILNIDSDEKYDLTYKNNNLQPKIGEIYKGDRITGTDLTKTIQIELNDFFIENINSNYTGVKAEISLSKIEEKFSEAELRTLYEFYLSGSLVQYFPRTTDRSKEERVKKSRYSIDVESEISEDIASWSQGSEKDFFFVETEYFDFIVQKVKNDFLPDWANGVQIEYRNSFKSIPDLETREAVSEIVGFVLGTHILKVGETHFDANNKIFKRIATNPWGDNVISKSKSNSVPPVSFKNYFDYGKIERVLNKLVPIYIDKRKELGLSDVLWKYWISKELAIGTNLPILSSSLESLAENYIDANSLIVTYTKEQKSEYRSLIEDDKKSISEKIIKYDFNNRVMNSIENPFDIGIGPKLKLFFNHLSITFTNQSVENQALRARNKMVHSTIDSSDESIKLYIGLTRAYQTLVNRVILKILKFDEKYVDYYSEGFPEKNIDENI